jgi:hypothetical protein
MVAQVLEVERGVEGEGEVGRTGYVSKQKLLGSGVRVRMATKLALRHLASFTWYEYSLSTELHNIKRS